MIIRRARRGDTEAVLKLLSQVLEVHAKIRPDIFQSGTTKYSADELALIFENDDLPVYLALDDEGRLLGYAFCQIRRPAAAPSVMIPRTILYIDDICVDEAARRQHVGKALFEHVRQEARRLHCDTITLNVWEGNEPALRFYREMGLTPRSHLMEYDLKKEN